MWFRILTKGLAIDYNPKAVVFHEHREDMKSLEKQVFNYMKGNTVAALVQQQYHPSSSYRSYVINTLKKKAKLFTLGVIRRRWFTTRILTLEIKGIIAGLVFFIRMK